MVRKCKALANVKAKAGLAAALAVAGLLSGCSVSSGLCDAFGPSKHASLEIPQDASVEEVFACIDQEITADADPRSLFEKGYAVRDPDAGVLETKHYSTPNVSGFHLRAEVSKKTFRLDLSLRGAGAYCTDLGVDNEMSKLKAGVSRCLQP
ncbi:hypothetical protein A9973_16860 [Achromobacter sp. UMC46]|nr:hypothetical protein [Achromobacter sp. UMC46]